MKVRDAGVFNLDETRPQVILFGNGLNYQDESSWKEILRKSANEGVETGSFWDDDKLLIPNSVYSVATGSEDDNERHRKLVKAFADYCYDDLSILEVLTRINADAFLTTNYTYDLESAIVYHYFEKSKDTKSKKRFFISSANHYSEKYHVHTFNSIGGRSVWHLHGELDKPQSLVITLDEYLREIGKLLEYNKQVGNKYEENSSSFSIKSWLDYFIIADVHILGLSMDFSELDLWWAINRRRRESGDNGQIYYYGYKTVEQQELVKRNVMSLMGVKIMDDYELKDGDYKSLYQRIILDINEYVNAAKH